MSMAFGQRGEQRRSPLALTCGRSYKQLAAMNQALAWEQFSL